MKHQIAASAHIAVVLIQNDWPGVWQTGKKFEIIGFTWLEMEMLILRLTQSRETETETETHMIN